MKRPEIQWHNELSLKAEKAMPELLQEMEREAEECTAVGVGSVTDPNPSAGYVLVAVIGGKSIFHEIGATVEQAAGSLEDVETLAVELSF